MILTKILSRHRTIFQLITLIAMALIFIIPQIYQQFIQDQLPATGDLIHRRIVYFLTNFPNFNNAPSLILSHSKLYHYFISYFNILTGLTGTNAFYGFGLINLIMLPLAVLALFILARRLTPRWAHLAPLFAFINPLLVFPFFGNADQHLMYIYLTVFLFIILFFQPTFKTKFVASILLGMTLNSSLVIWLPLILIVLLLEYFYPLYRPLLLTFLALILYIPFLRIPIGYLAFGDFLHASVTYAKIIIALIIGLITTIIFYKVVKNKPHLRHTAVLITFFALILFFLLARTNSPFPMNVRPEQLAAVKQVTQSTSFINYLFSINPNKYIAGFTIYVPLIVLFAILIGAILYRTKEFPIVIRALAIVLFIPACLILLRFLLFKINFDYFVKTPLYNLHIGRIMSLTFFILPVLLVWFLPKLKIISRQALIFVLAVMIINISIIANFFTLRVYPNWTQQKYQKMIQTSLEQGIEENLSSAEVHYACHYYNHCTLQGQADIQF